VDSSSVPQGRALVERISMEEEMKEEAEKILTALKAELERNISPDEIPVIFYDGGLDRLLFCSYMRGQIDYLDKETNKMIKEVEELKKNPRIRLSDWRAKEWFKYWESRRVFN
jgi:hypothetical protein